MNNFVVSSFSNLPMVKGRTNIVEGTAGGWRNLEEAWVDERSEGRRRLVFLHVVTGLALKRGRIRLSSNRILRL